MPELVAKPALESDARGASELRGAGITGVGMSVPDGVVTNAPIADRLGIDTDWIARRTGVRERRIAEPELRLTDLAAQAGATALDRAGVTAAELDLVLVATMSADELTPNSAPLVAATLGADRAGAIDIGAACTGFVSGLALAAAQIEAGRADAVLLVGADVLSRITDPDDRSTAPLLADGAGAAVLRPTPPPGRIAPAVLGADGRRGDLIFATRGEGVIRMNGHETFKHAVARMCEATLAALARSGRELTDIDLFVYHQANSRIIRAVGEELGLPGERVVDYVPSYGNTSAATIPMALALAEREGRLAMGDTVLLAAFGAGLTWGAAVVEWGDSDA